MACVLWDIRPNSVNICVAVQSLNHVCLFAMPWTVAYQALLFSTTITQSLLRFMSLSPWCYLTISSSAIPFSSCPQSFLASRYFTVSQLFASRDQSIGVSASASVLSMNIQGWFPLGLTGWISLQSKRLSRIFIYLLSSIETLGEGNGNPLQCSCLENPRDGGASWAAVYGVAQSRTRLRRLSSSSSIETLGYLSSINKTKKQNKPNTHT